MKLSLPQNRWNGDQPVEINIPDDWDVGLSVMEGDSYPALSYEELKAKIDSPIGCEPIYEMAKGKKSACIVFDDNTRPTPIKEMAHIVLDELLEAGVPKDRIIFICALGCHGTCELDDFVKKLGADICREYPVYNHNCFFNLTDVGTTSHGIKVMINNEFMAADIKIGLGAITPHAFNGFGGGCKIVLPGIAGFDTNVTNHKVELSRVMLNRDRPFYECHGNLQYKGVREDEEEAAMLAGLDFKVDALLNSSCEVIDAYCGHPIKEYYEGIKKAQVIYNTPHLDKAEVVIVNANAKANEATFAVNIGADHVLPGGDVVMVNFNKVGLVNHYLGCQWGFEAKGPLSPPNKNNLPLPNGMRQLIMFNPYPEYKHAITYGNPEQVKWASTWEEVMGYLGDRKAGTKCSVFKEVILSMFADDYKKDYTPVNLDLTKENVREVIKERVAAQSGNG